MLESLPYPANEQSPKKQLNYHSDRLHEAFGNDIKATLEQLHYSDCLTKEQIGSKKKYSVSRVTSLMEEFHVENIAPDKDWLRQFHNHVVNILPSLWKSPDTLSQLPPEEKDIFTRRYLTEGKPPTLDAIGEEYELDYHEMYVTEANALTRLTLIFHDIDSAS
jgi:hypothetical protein